MKISKRIIALIVTAFISSSCENVDIPEQPDELIPDHDSPTETNNGYPDAELIYGDIISDRTLDASKVYRLVGNVKVTDGATLTVPAGTKIVGDFRSKSRLVVLLGGKIIASGTKDKPIVFTSSRKDGIRARGDWGGIVLNGKAPNNGPNGTLVGEGETGTHGGTYPMDNSGILKYVRVEFGGIEISTDNEINSFTFNSVGAGTTLEYLQSHYGLDDGFEWFGGTVNAKYLVSSGNDDDCFDTDNGWIGKGQFWVSVQATDKGNRGYESNNDGNASTATPNTHPIVYNTTLIGRGTDGNEYQAMKLRGNTQGSYYNHIISHWKEGMVVDGDTKSKFDSDKLFVKNSMFWVYGNSGNNNTGNDTIATVNKSYEAYKEKNSVSAFGNKKGNPNFRSHDYANPIKGTTPDLRPEASVDITTGAATPSDPASRYTGEKTNFFDGSANYMGAFKDSNWLEGWTTWATN